MGHTFGLFTKSQQGVLFANMRARVANQNDYGNPNHPQHLPESPNAPRVRPTGMVMKRIRFLVTRASARLGDGRRFNWMRWRIALIR